MSVSAEIKIIIDPKAGFCSGVTRAIAKLEEALAMGGKVFALGAPVHNDFEIKRLESLGLSVISHAQIPTLPSGCTVFIRAHGEAPSTYQALSELNCRIIDGSCPVVSRLQQHVKKASQDDKVGTIVFGKPDHPEVIGLLGQSEGKVFATQDAGSVKSSLLADNVMLCSQTTMETDAFQQFKDALINTLENDGWQGELRVKDSICAQVSQRWPSLETIAMTCDVVLFVSGHASSNGRMLFEKAKGVNPNIFFISEMKDFQAQFVARANTIGISGATSTPRSMLEDLARYVESCLRP